ncbi:MAG: C69 family dipeptidase [Synergistaceae bacterium]|nr:C69 family dipeptidase [Synergistaceae bacterium]
MRKYVAVLLLVVMIASSLAEVAGACTAVIVGKNASATGEVLLGHNEDNDPPLIMVQYYVPRAKHAAGELVVLEGANAKIPQVEETWGYFWTETRAPYPGSSFSDGFINEWGVAIVSNSCWPSIETAPEISYGGIKHGIRRFMAERAKSAREAVEIAVELLDKYGYDSSGRSYQIADKDEAWVLQVVNGKNYAARRVPDDEVLVIPNHYIIRKIDFNDKENYITSPGLVKYAIMRGWYKPAKEGDYSDFDFAVTYQRPEYFRHPSNLLRHAHGISILTGEEFDQTQELPFSFKTDKKIGIDDVKRVLRTHYDGTRDDLTTDSAPSPHLTRNRVICAPSTHESVVIQLRENPAMTVMWKTTGHPCTSPFVPWYVGSEKVPASFGWIEPKLGRATHFSPEASDISYNPSRAWWAFQELQYLADPQYRSVIGQITAWRDKLEKDWAKEQAAVDRRILNSYTRNKAAGKKAMADYTEQQAAKAVKGAKDLSAKLAGIKIQVLSERVNFAKEDVVKIALLAGGKIDVNAIDKDALRFTPAFPGEELENISGELIESEMLDVNKNKKNDLVVSFKSKKEWTEMTYPGSIYMVLEGKDPAGNVFVGTCIVDIVR